MLKSVQRLRADFFRIHDAGLLDHVPYLDESFDSLDRGADWALSHHITQPIPFRMEFLVSLMAGERVL